MTEELIYQIIAGAHISIGVTYVALMYSLVAWNTPRAKKDIGCVIVKWWFWTAIIDLFLLLIGCEAKQAILTILVMAAISCATWLTWSGINDAKKLNGG